MRFKTPKILFLFGPVTALYTQRHFCVLRRRFLVLTIFSSSRWAIQWGSLTFWQRHCDSLFPTCFWIFVERWEMGSRHPENQKDSGVQHITHPASLQSQRVFSMERRYRNGRVSVLPILKVQFLRLIPENQMLDALSIVLIDFIHFSQAGGSLASTRLCPSLCAKKKEIHEKIYSEEFI